MKPQADDEADDSRREFLLQALSLGLLAGGSGWQTQALAGVLGELPGKLPQGRSIFSMQGEVLVNGRPASRDTPIGPEDHVKTGKGASLVAVVGQDALILRGDSELKLDAGRAARQFFRLVSGAMLTVFGRRERELSVYTPTATIGIRGTGVYFEADPEKTYVCTCYGRVQIEAGDDPAVREEIVARHHDAPRYVLAKPQNGRRIVPASFQWHTDLELMTLEALVGREVPFKLEAGQYKGPRREY
ncbi:hypothetical protein C3942_10565 [Solimonas fluminis]|uniref:FecR protein domain-containing protein n=1 Tax=Solimonas fluminis TaxID=2086571 RepID=A0A2S5TFW0_9GAMM|nr:FecR domain-containing protein [Solimonas fluminis]PPE73839.1 hypothetical protein C3942_10565 [Solimonas fluminis]